MKRKIAMITSVICLLASIIVSSNATSLLPLEELENLRSAIKTVEDIDSAMYTKLESVMLQKFTDIKKGDWYMSVMTKLVGLGSLDGTGTGRTMSPNDTITKAMFIKMFIRAMFGVGFLDTTTADFDHWSAKDIKKAEEVGILAQGEYTLANINVPITRGEMAKLIVRAYNKYEKSLLTVDQCRPLSTSIKDYNTTSKDIQPYVLLVYGSGIISGYSDGRFGASEYANRAQGSAFIIRYLDVRERAKVTIPTGARAPMTIDSKDASRPMAIAGDTFIKPDGTKVVLEVGPSGVIGEGQGVATEIGRAHPNGKPIKDGDLGSNEKFLGQPYLVDKKTGEGHYQGEWDDIAQNLQKEAFEKLGHPKDGTMYGTWLIYQWGQWNWIGP